MNQTILFAFLAALVAILASALSLPLEWASGNHSSASLFKICSGFDRRDTWHCTPVEQYCDNTYWTNRELYWELTRTTSAADAFKEMRGKLSVECPRVYAARTLSYVQLALSLLFAVLVGRAVFDHTTLLGGTLGLHITIVVRLALYCFITSIFLDDAHALGGMELGIAGYLSLFGLGCELIALGTVMRSRHHFEYKEIKEGDGSC